MYEIFTDRARKAMQYANREALRFCYEYIGTEHLLLGLVAEADCVAANLLENRGIGLEKEIGRAACRERGGTEVRVGTLVMKQKAKKVIEYAIEEAHELNHNCVGTDHC